MERGNRGGGFSEGAPRRHPENTQEEPKSHQGGSQEAPKKASRRHPEAARAPKRLQEVLEAAKSILHCKNNGC